jgi:RNA polymerase sigma-70 factor (ECF subfamily)
VTTLPRVRPLLAEATTRAGKPSVVRAFFGDGADVADPDEASCAPMAIGCDHATLVSLYVELAPRVHRFLRDLLGDPTLASDATQETFVRAFRRVDDLPRATRLVPWVFGVARFVALEMRKARGRGRRVIDDGVAADDRAMDTRARTPEDALLDREAVAVVERALGRLPEERRAALLLRCDHGLAYDEIAPLMGWSLSKVKVEIFRAREVLRATLHEYRGGGT